MDEPTIIAATTAPVPPGYPAGWEADVVLADGGTARIRPIRPDDGPRIVDFHGRQSPESIYFRYFTPRPRLPEQEVERLTHIDYADRMAFVALRDDVLVGVARYDRLPTRSEAEVAFFVDDRHQGRGIATVLLEYLAEAARRTGIAAFTATVLPSNGRMVAVFRNAGFTAASRFGDGVIEVRLDLQPTPEAEAAITARAQRAEAEAVRRLLAPRSVAVIGAGRDPSGVGHAVLRNLLEHEFAGPVHAVNPTADQVAGVTAVHDINDIDGPVDLAIVVVPASQVPAVVEDCGRKGVPAVIVISAGFAEAGPEGAALSAAALRAARRFGTRLLGPNCLGVINTDPQVRLHATFATPDPRPGPVALLSESGTIGGVILDHIGDAGLGASSFAAIGNRADVSANDMLQYWADDPRTELVLLYLESFGNARKFSRIARDLGRTKPIVAVKSRGAARAYPTDGAEAPTRPQSRRSSSRPAWCGLTRCRSCWTSPGCWHASRCPMATGWRSWAMAADPWPWRPTRVSTPAWCWPIWGPAFATNWTPGSPEHRRRRGCGPAPSTWDSRPAPTTWSGRCGRSSATRAWTACWSSAHRRRASRRPNWCAPWRRRGPGAPTRRCWRACSAPTQRPSRWGRDPTCQCSTSRMPPPTRWGG